ncbi:MAG: PASTA domain-containing protein [Pseudonocardiaceae bacterium]|nr:PASTA domain-containing protein [Pseudonocardiaceae bacterium]
MTEVPDVVGFDASDACAMVRAAGLEPCGPDHTTAPTTGTVTAQRPISAAGAERGAQVTLWTTDRPGGSVPLGSPRLAPGSPVPVE